MRIATYTRLDPGFRLCRDIRTAIFVDEYNVPASKERDHQDYGATHYLIRHDDMTPIGVARSHIEGDYCKIQRFAFLPPYRHDELRTQAFTMILEHCAKKYPFLPIQVYAREEECEFYMQFGFQPEGDMFLYADFQLQAMNLPPQFEKTSLTNPHLAVITESVQAV